MGWPLTATEAAIFGGDHQISVEAVAWYDGQPTTDPLEVIEASLSSTLQANTVRTTLQLTVDDQDGQLIPLTPTDPLAPFGQTLAVAVIATTAHTQVRIPQGEYWISTPAPTGGWRAWRKRLIPSGGTIGLTGHDAIQPLVESEIAGLMQPATGKLAAEITRLTQAITSTDVTQIPDTATCGIDGVIYEGSRLDTIESLIKPYGLLARMGRDGVVAIAPPPATASRDLTVASGDWITAHSVLDREGIYNTWITRNPDTSQDGTQIGAIIVENTGPFRASGPLKPRIYRHASPLYSTNAAARRGAETLQKTHLQDRAIDIEVQATFDPTIDVGDLHHITIRPSQIECDARLVAASYKLTGGPMQLTYRIPWQEVQSWPPA